MAGFIGRSTQLAELTRILDQIASSSDDKPGRALLMRGRRRVGKSSLVEKFLDQSGVPGVFFAASKQSTPEELRLFGQAVLESNLPNRSAFEGVVFTSWDAALRLLDNILPTNGPSLVIIDELPYLMEPDHAFEGTLQKIFDRDFSRKKVLLIGIGSDLAMMEALNEYNRPFHQRATEMVIPPLSPAEVADMVGLNAADAFDAYLITGGLPMICQDWQKGQTTWKFLKGSLTRSTSPLIVSGERSLAAEFPSSPQARTILTAIGSGSRTFTNIAQAAGGLQQKSVQRGLEVLVNKRIVVVDVPLSTKKSSNTRYRITDPYLQFWLRFIGPNLPEIERSSGERVFEKVKGAWASWRGLAIEPIIRESLERIPNPKIATQAPVVGSYWTRTNQPEIDIVVADSEPIAKTIYEVGSIKWYENKPFGASDLKSLIQASGQLPGTTAATQLVVVSRSGFKLTSEPNIRQVSPSDLLNAWR